MGNVYVFVLVGNQQILFRPFCGLHFQYQFSLEAIRVLIRFTLCAYHPEHSLVPGQYSIQQIIS